MPWFSGGGSGGGLTSVTTDATLTGNGTGGSPLSASPIQNSDGVTLQGNGTAASKYAIKAVQVSARITGTGAVGSGLDVAGWPVTAYVNFSLNNVGFGFTVNKLMYVIFPLGYSLLVSRASFNVHTADAVNNTDFGIYNSAGTLVANIGAQILGSTGDKIISFVQGSVAMPPGLYAGVFTSNGSTFQTLGSTTNYSLGFSSAYSASSGGACPATITFPTVTPAPDNVAFQLLP